MPNKTAKKKAANRKAGLSVTELRGGKVVKHKSEEVSIGVSVKRYEQGEDPLFMRMSLGTAEHPELGKVDVDLTASGGTLIIRFKDLPRVYAIGVDQLATACVSDLEKLFESEKAAGVSDA